MTEWSPVHGGEGRDPWEGYEDGATFGADALYSGPHEVIEDIVLLTDVCLAFEYWADDFRYWDRLESPVAASRWEQESKFAELTSINMANAAARE